MKKYTLKIISLALALLMLLLGLIACKNEDKVPDGSDSQATDDVTSTGDVSESQTEGERYDENGYLMDDLPETYDYEGVDFDILQWKQGEEFIPSEGSIVDTVSRAKYNSQKAVEQRFNIRIKPHIKMDGWAETGDKFLSSVEASIMGNLGTYDMVASYSATVGRGVNQGYYMNLYDLNYIDFEKPWWPKNLVASAEIGENIYYCAGDINAESQIKYLEAMYVNLDMYEEHRIADIVGGRSIYALVKDGDWTIENMQKMALGTTGNADDIYGFSWSDGVMSDAFMYAGGFSLIKTTNGTLSLNTDLQSARMVTWLENCQLLLSGDHIDSKESKTAFAEGKALFGGDDELTVAQQYIKDGRVNFSVIPLPKYDRDQTDYYTCMAIFSCLIAVPSDVIDPQMVGMIMEGIASSNHRNVKDIVYYDVFQSRYASAEDAEGADMFDILYQSVTFDVGRVFCNQFGFPFRQACLDSSVGWSSVYEQNYETWGTKITEIYSRLG